MKRLFLALALVLALVAVSPVMADDVDDAFTRATTAYGRGDYAAALKDLLFAADKGYGPAQYDLGLMNNLGQGVPQNYAEAMKWYLLAAEWGVPQAKINLGRMYAKGEGVPQDYVRAYMWASLAIAGLPPGEDRDGAAKNRDLDAAHLTPKQIDNAKTLAREWTKEHKVKSK